MDSLFDKKFISSKEASEISGYHSDYLARLCRSGKIVGTRIGRSWVINRDSLQNFVARQEAQNKKNAKKLAQNRQKEYRAAKSVRNETLVVSIAKTAPSPLTFPSSFRQQMVAGLVALVVLNVAVAGAYAEILPAASKITVENIRYIGFEYVPKLAANPMGTIRATHREFGESVMSAVYGAQDIYIGMVERSGESVLVFGTVARDAIAKSSANDSVLAGWVRVSNNLAYGVVSGLYSIGDLGLSGALGTPTTIATAYDQSVDGWVTTTTTLAEARGKDVVAFGAAVRSTHDALGSIVENEFLGVVGHFALGYDTSRSALANTYAMRLNTPRAIVRDTRQLAAAVAEVEVVPVAAAKNTPTSSYAITSSTDARHGAQQLSLTGTSSRIQPSGAAPGTTAPVTITKEDPISSTTLTLTGSAKSKEEGLEPALTLARPSDLAAAAGVPESVQSLSEEVALYTYETITGWFNRTTSALATYIGVPTTKVVINFIASQTVQQVTVVGGVPASAGSTVATNYVYVDGVTYSYLEQRLAQLRAQVSNDIYDSIDNSNYSSGGGGGSGSVTSVDASGGTTGLTFTGGPITSTGTFTLGGTLGIANGGTGITNAPLYGELLMGDGVGGYTLVATSTLGIGAGTGSPGGATTQVQFNNAGLFAGDAGFTYNSTTDVLTVVNGLFTSATTTALGINSETFLDLTGTGLLNVGGALSLDATGNWTGSFDGQEGSYYLANSFSTTSASYFLSQNQGTAFSTTSADFWQTQRNFFSSTSAAYFLGQNQGLAFSTSSASYFLSQNQGAGFSTTSALYFLAQNQSTAFSTTSANYWETQQTARTADDLTNNSIEDLNDVAAMVKNYGDLLFWNGSTWSDIATSSLGLTVNTAGDWTGTFDGQEGSYYLSRANHTGTQAASTISDFTTAARALFSGTYPLEYNSGTGTFSLAFSTTTQNAWSQRQDFNGGATTTALTVSGSAWFPSLANGCAYINNGILASTGVACGSGSGGITSVNGDTGPAVVLDTGDIAESGNLYYLDTRVQDYLNTLSKGYFFSSTSATYFIAQNQGAAFSTTSANYWETQQTARTADDLTNNSIEDLNDVAAMTETLGDLLSWNGSAWTNVATSTLGFIANTSGDWTGTFDGQQGTFYLDRANHTGTQLASTISDFSSTARGLISSAATGLSYTAGTGVVSLTAGYVIPLTASTTEWASAYANRITSAVYPLQISSNVLSLAFGTTTANTWGAHNIFTSLFATNASTTNATTTNLGLNSETFTDLTGTGLQNVGGALTLNATGDWIGTFDGQEGSYYLANSFSTTSANYWETQQTARTADDLTNNSIEDLSDVASMTETFGDLLSWNGSTWTNVSTSTLGLSTFAYLFPNNATTTGLGLYASTTIGNGSQNGGLTVSGGATTTGSVYVGGNLGVGTTSPTAKIQALATTEQLRLGYDAANYASFTTSSNGSLTVGLTGSGNAATIGNAGSTVLISGYVRSGASGSAASPGFAFNSGNNNGIFLATTNQLGFSTNGSERMRIGATGNVGIGSTTPYARLGVSGFSSGAGIVADALSGFVGNLLDLKLASSTVFSVNEAGLITGGALAVTSATTTNLGLNSETFTDLTGTGLQNVGGTLTLNATGDWTGTFDGQEGSYYLANSFSTTSASYFLSQNQSSGFSTTSANYFFGTKSIEDLIDVAAITETYGDLLGWNGSSWIDFATSTLGISLADTTGTLGQTRGGTGVTSYTAGDLLYADALGNLTTLAIGSAGQVLKVTGGLPQWGVDLTTGGGGGAGAWATTTDSLAIYPADTSDVVIVGNSATSTANSIFEVHGRSYFSNLLGIGTTTPGAMLSVAGGAIINGATTIFGGVNAPIYTATSTTATSTLPNLLTSAFRLGSDYVTDLTGTGLQVVGGALTLNATGDWTGTFDGQEGSYYLANSFSTTSASYFLSQNQGAAFSTTSANYWETQQTARSADDLTNNSIEDLNDVAAMTEAFGDLLYWNGSVWADIATSSLGLITSAIQSIGPAGQTQTGPGVTFASSTSSFNGLTAALAITGSGNTITYTPSLSGTLNNAGLTNSTVSYGGVTVSLGGSDATPAFDLADATNLPISTGVSGLGTGIATFLATPTSANLATAVTNETGSGALVFGTSPTISGASLTGVTSILNASTSALSAYTLAVGGSGTTTVSSTGALSTPSLTIGSLTGLLKATAGVVSVATAGTDYENVLSFTYPLIRSVNTISLAFGTTTANTWGAHNIFTSLFATNASTTNATTTNLGINSETFTDLTGTGLQNVGGSLTLNATGDWTGTFDGQEGSYYLNRANHTGTQLSSTISDFAASVNSYINGSTTIPKTYTTNTFTGGQTFNGGITIGSLNGPLQANAGVVSATTSIGVLYGGTGLTSAPTYGQLLMGNGSGGYALTATSSLGLITNAIQSIGPAGQLQTGPAVTFASSTTGTDFTITATGNAITFNLPSASASNRGLLTTSDWSLFNSKISSTSLDTSSELASLIGDETGTGALVFANSPVFTTPNLGTPSAVTLTNGTGLPISTGVSGLGTGVATFLATPSSANLATAVSDETGSGALVFGTSPTLTTPNLGTPSAVTLTNATGLPIVGGTTGTLTVARGGTGTTTAPAGQVLYGGGAGVYQSVATTSVTIGSGLSFSGTFGSVLGGVAGTLSLNTTGDWTGIFDGQEGSYYLANSFSTTSANYWETQQTARTADDLTNNSIEDLNDVASMTKSFGNLLSWNGSTWTNIATSTLGFITGAGGSDTQVQYNASGALAGDSGFTYNAAADRLTATYASTTGFSSSYASSTNAFFNTLTVGKRVVLDGSPVYDLASGALATHLFIPFSGSSHTVGASTNMNAIRISALSGATLDFSVGANADAVGVYSDLSASSTSDSTSDVYAGVFHATNAGPGTVRGIHAGGWGTTGSTGVINGVASQLSPVSTNSAASNFFAVLTSSGVNDLAVGYALESAGDRYAVGFGNFVNPLPIGSAYYRAWFSNTSSAGARAFQILNHSGTELGSWDKDGNIYTTANLSVGSTSPWGLVSIQPNGITGPAFVIGSSTGTSFVVTNGGQIGLGTSTPNASYRLTVAGNAKVHTSNPQIALISDVQPNGWSLQAIDSDGRFRVFGNSAERLSITSAGNVGIATTSPYATLSVAGTSVVTGLATFSSGINVNSETLTDLTGTGLQNVGGTLTLNATGDWTGTLDGQEGSYYLSRANHTGTQLASTISDFNSSVNSYINGSTTIPKTYTANTFTGGQTFSGGVTIGSLNGPLQANAGVISATTSIGVLYGGTGLTTAPAYGQLLMGNGSGGYALTATSSLGLVTSAVTAIGPAGQTQTGPTVTLASSTTGTDFTITATGNAITFNLPSASASNRGLLATSDWSLFNNKISSTSLDSSSELASLITDETGSGALVFANSPSFTTPNLGTPSAVTLTNGTGLPISSGVSGLGTGVATALGVNVGTAGSFVVNGGALGTPSSGTLTNATGLPIVAGTTGTLSVARGGTGTTTAPSGQVLYGGGDGVYRSVATTSVTIGSGLSFSGTFGSVLAGVAGTLSLDTTGNWTGTFDGQEGSYYLANSFSTTSANYWETQQTARTADDLTNNSIEDLSDVAAMTETFGDLLYWNGSAWTDIATSSLGLITSAIQSIGPAGQLQTGPAVTFASSTTGTDFTITATGNAITFNLPSASASNRGLLTTSDWTVFNNKISSTSLDTSSELASLITDETGSGALVFATSPTLVTPNLGTPSAITLTNGTGLPISTGVSGLGTGIATFLATPSSANLATAITDETGSGALVFATSPAFTTPNLGTPSAATLTNATGLPIIGGTTGTLTVARGGTGSTTAPSGQVLYGGGAGVYQSVATTSVTIGSGLSYSGTFGALLGGAAGTLSIDTTGDWTGTFDGQQGTFYLDRANHTGTQLASTISDFNSSVNSYVNGSTTIPKTYTTNTFTGAQTFSGGVTIGSLNGPLQANAGVVSATTSIGVLYGGTGLTSAPSYGQLLMGNGSGGYSLVATSSLGITASLSYGSDNQLPFVNATNDGFEYSSNLTYDGTTFTVTGAGNFTTSFVSPIITTNANTSVSNFRAGAANSIVSQVSQASLQIAGSTNVQQRVFFNGNSATTLTANTSYAGIIVGTQGATEGTSGTHGLLANVAINAPAFTNGTAATTDATTLYIAGAPTGITPTNTATALWVDTGIVRIDDTLGIGTSSPWQELSVAGDISLTGRFYDSAASAGTNGMVLLSTGSATTWVATSTLGLSSGSGVTSVDASGGTTGLSFTGGPITTSGTLTLSGTLNVGNGGTGAASFTNNRLITGNGSSALVDEANLTFDGSLLTVTGNASTSQLTTTGNTYLGTSGGKVGIGTTTPQKDLVIQATSGSTAGQITFDSGGATNRILAISSSQINVTTALGVAQSLVLNASGGNVGIGTTSPFGNFAVAGASGLDGATPTTIIADSTNNGTWTVGAEFSRLDFSNQDTSSTGDNGTKARIAGVIETTTGGSTGLAFYTSNATFSEKLRISSAGNVGIGTTTPGSLLSIGGIANFTSATTTFYGTGGIDLAGGCFAINGTCVGGSGGSGTVGSGVTGQFPYYAANGTTLTATSTLFLATTGNVGIGTTTPSAKLHVANDSSGPTTAWSIFVDPDSTNGATAPGFGLGKYLGVSAIQSFNNAALALNPVGGSIGIGTTTPSGNGSKLFVTGDATGASTGQLTLNGSTDPLRQLIIGYDTTNNYGQIQAIQVGTAFRNLVLNAGGGNVGIGTTTPQWSLTVASSTGPQVALTDGTSTSNQWTIRSISSSLYFATSSPTTFATTTVAALSINSSGVTNFSLCPTILGSACTGSAGLVRATSPTIATPTISTSAIIPIVNGGSAAGSTLTLRSTSGAGVGADAIIFGVGNNGAVERGRMNLGGFGLGTTTPRWNLQIASSTAAQLALSDGSATSNHWLFRNAGGNLYVDTGSATTFATTSTSALTILSGGSVGIGSSTPNSSYRLTVAGNAQIYTANPQLALISGSIPTGWNLQGVDADARFRIFGNAAERLTITSGGNVGIGTSSPIDLLSIYGGATAGSINMGVWDSLRNGIALNGQDASSATNYNLLSGAGDLNFYLNRPTGNAIKFREANGATDQFTLGASGASTFPDGNLSVCTGGACPSGSPAGNGNLIVETAVGVGSSTPWTGLALVSGKAIVVAENTLATSTSMTVDWRNGNQQLVRLGTAGTTISFSGFIEGQKLVLTVCNPAATAGAITWGTQVLWAGGTAPTQTTTANKCDVWSFLATTATSTLKIFGTQTANF